MIKDPEVDVPAAPAKTRQGYGLRRVYKALVAQDRAPGKVIKVRVDIDRDSYDFQSHYRTEMLTPNGWVPLHSLPYSEIEPTMPSYVLWDRDRTSCVAAVEAVAQRLVRESYKMLEPF